MPRDLPPITRAPLTRCRNLTVEEVPTLKTRWRSVVPLAIGVIILLIPVPTGLTVLASSYWL